MDFAVRRHLDSITPERRRRDAETMVELITRVTGLEPKMRGTIIGFGQYHYKYASGREGDAPAAGFAARKAATTIYVLDGTAAHEKELARLGEHTTGVGCIYVKDLGKVDLGVLEEIVKNSYAALSERTYTKRASEG